MWNVVLRYITWVRAPNGHLLFTNLSHAFKSILCTRHWLPTRNLVLRSTVDVVIFETNVTDNATFWSGTNWQLFPLQRGNWTLVGSANDLPSISGPKLIDFLFSNSRRFFYRQNLHLCIGAVCWASTIAAPIEKNTAKILNNIFIFSNSMMNWPADWPIGFDEIDNSRTHKSKYRFQSSMPFK